MGQNTLRNTTTTKPPQEARRSVELRSDLGTVLDCGTPGKAPWRALPARNNCGRPGRPRRQFIGSFITNNTHVAIHTFPGRDSHTGQQHSPATGPRPQGS